MAREISSIMPGWRPRSSATPPSRNGRPPYRNTIVPSTGATHCEPGNWGGVKPQPLLDHLGVEDHRDGQDQAQPEPVPELGRVVPVAATASTVAALVGGGPARLGNGSRVGVLYARGVSRTRPGQLELQGFKPARWRWSTAGGRSRSRSHRSIRSTWRIGYFQHSAASRPNR